MDRNWGSRDKKKDLEVSDLPSHKPNGTYEMKGTAFIRQETDEWRETGRKRYALNIKK